MTIPLFVLAKHSVTRACFVREYQKVNEVAGLFGHNVSGVIEEGYAGILMMNDLQASAGQIWASETNQQPPCIEGKNIKLMFEAIDPDPAWKERWIASEAVRFRMRRGRLISE